MISALDIDVANSLVPPHETRSEGASAAMQAAQVRYSLPADQYRTATAYRTTTWLRRHAYANADADADANADADAGAEAEAEVETEANADADADAESSSRIIVLCKSKG